RVFEFAGSDVLMPDVPGAREFLRIALVGFGKRGRVGCDGDRSAAQGTLRGPREIGRIGASGIRDDYAAHPRQCVKKSTFLGFHDLGIGEGYNAHNSSISAAWDML